MNTSTQVYRELKAAQFSEAQARTLVDILQAAGVVEPESPESELERIEQHLLAEPFQPFVIEMSSGKSYRIERRDQCGFTRLGSVQLSGLDDGKLSILSTDHNHPSGDPSPSEADIRLTRRLNEASRLLQIPLLDHVILGQRTDERPGYFSFREVE
jgi:hypothetical protein